MGEILRDVPEEKMRGRDNGFGSSKKEAGKDRPADSKEAEVRVLEERWPTLVLHASDSWKRQDLRDMAVWGPARLEKQCRGAPRTHRLGRTEGQRRKNQ